MKEARTYRDAQNSCKEVKSVILIRANTYCTQAKTGCKIESSCKEAMSRRKEGKASCKQSK